MPALTFWQLLKPGTGTWTISIKEAGFVQLFRKQTSEAVTAFAFRAGASFGAKLAEALKSAGSGPFEAKLVVSTGSAEWAHANLTAAGVKIFKTVERAGPFELRFDSAQQKILVEAKSVVPASIVRENSTKEPEIKVEPNRRTRVMIVDDSPTIRKVLEKIISSDSSFEVVASVGLPSEVETAIQRHRPDVITLDIHLPEMNGVELLKKYLPRYRIPTIMISSISVEEGPLVLNALEAGAVDYIQKPSAHEIGAVSPFILMKLKAVAGASLVATTPQQVKRTVTRLGAMDQRRLLAIGSSTGGTEALRELFLALPAEIPPVVVVQHIPAVFSKALADRLNGLCPFEVVEGEESMEVIPNRVIIAPGGKHMCLAKRGTGCVVKILDTEPVNRHKPSVDVLMDSVAELWGKRAVGVILTGMGSDGAKGLLSMKKAGAPTFGQDERSCVVFGMPQAAMKLGATNQMVSLNEMADVLVQVFSEGRKRTGSLAS